MLAKMKKTKVTYILLIGMCLCMPLRAQIKGAGSGVFNFLNLPASSRLNALGGENVAIADDDISMAFVNPSLLTAHTDKVLQLNYAYYLAGTMFGSVMYGHNYQDNYFGAAVHYLDYGQMEYADEMLYLCILPTASRPLLPIWLMIYIKSCSVN